jgi:ribosomal protein L24
MSLQAIRKYYGIDVKRGQEVEIYNGKRGKVLSAKGMRLRVLVDGVKELHHPTFEMKYL